MDRRQLQFAIFMLLAMAAFYGIGVGLEQQLGSAAVFLGGLVALAILFIPNWLLRKKSSQQKKPSDK